MSFVVVYDANVLYPVHLRDLLLRIARAGIVRARWSEQILDEMLNALRRERPDISEEKLARTRALIIEAVPDCLVTRHEGLADDVQLVDPNDLHVLAAAIRAQAQVIVTYNLRHFPDHAIAPYDLETKHPDEFVLDAIDLFPSRVVAIIHEMANDFRNPPMSVEEVLASLRRRELVRSVARLREMMST